jgi:hypothetical protein
VFLRSDEQGPRIIALVQLQEEMERVSAETGGEAATLIAAGTAEAPSLDEPGQEIPPDGLAPRPAPGGAESIESARRRRRGRGGPGTPNGRPGD